jgi:NADPH:quinone reductase-like Zn-dependent oxidoreductase
MATIPTTMRAARVPRHGGPEVIEIKEIPVPRPGPDEVLVKVHAAALNHLDLWVRRGLDTHTFPLPLTPCADVAGEVAAAGEASGAPETGSPVVLSPGVCCGHCRACLEGKHQFCRSYGLLGEQRDGGAAEYICVPGRNLVKKPERLSFVEAACLPITFLTAWTMVRRRADVQPGEWVLVQAGASGVGVAAIQMCKLLGARVIATAGSPEKVAGLLDLGADVAVNYREQDVVKEVRAATGRGGVSCVLDHVGADTFDVDQRVLGWAGRVVLCGATTGHKVTVDLRRLFFKSQSLLGSTMGSMGDFAEVVELVGQGLLEPVVDRVFPLEETADAQAHLEARKAFGKVVIGIV